MSDLIKKDKKKIKELELSIQALRISEEKYRRVWEYAPDAIFLTKIGGEDSGMILDANPAASMHTGYSLEELIGMNIVTALPADKGAKFLVGNREKELKKGNQIIFSEKKKRKDGSEYWTEVHIRDVLVGDEQIALAINRDITAFKVAEEELKYRAEMLNQAPVIIAHHDLNHHLVWANRKYLEITSLTLAELKGKTCWQVWNLEKPCSNCPVLISLKTGESVKALLAPENQEHWPDTQGSWFVQSAPVRDKNGKVVGAIETAMDVTRQQQAETMLKIELEKNLEEKTKEVIEKNKELQRFNDVMVDRELRMSELYDENIKLKEELKKKDKD